MKILHITTHFFPFIGGLENLVFQIACEQAKKHDVSILTLKHNPNLPDQEIKDGIKIFRVAALEILKNQYLWPSSNFPDKIAEIAPDVLFTHTRFFRTSYLAGKYVKQSSNFAKFELKFPRWIHVEHGQNFVESKNLFISLMARVVDYTWGKWIFQNADEVICVSETGAEFIKKLSGEFANIIHTGVHISSEIFSLPRKNKSLFFGRCIAEKGILEILEVAKFCPKWQFELVGSGPLFEIQELPNVIWTPEVPHEKINEKIQSADLIILPSWSESLSMAVLEAAANGRMILATDVGENSKIISPNFLTPSKNTKVLIQKLDFLYDNFEEMEKEGIKNLKKVQNDYSFEVMINKYDKLINEQ